MVVALRFLVFATAGYFIYGRCYLWSLKVKSENYIVQSGETLEQIAKKYRISWKNLAKMNKIKPPYTIKGGQKIIVPIKND